MVSVHILQKVQLCLLLLLIFGNHVYSETFIDKLNNGVQEKARNGAAKVGSIINSVSPCQCADRGCACRFSVYVDQLKLQREGEVSFQLTDDNALKTEIKVGKADRTSRLESSAGTSGMDLPPICVPIPEFPVIQICAVFYDIKLDPASGARVCTSLEAQAINQPVVAVQFDCINFSQNGISSSPPERIRPGFLTIQSGSNQQVTFFNKDPSNAALSSSRSTSAVVNPDAQFSFNIKPPGRPGFLKLNKNKAMKN